MKHLILSPSSFILTGQTLFDVVFSSRALSINREKRCVQVNGEDDTITFSDEPNTGYHGPELDRELAHRGLTLLKRMGYLHYMLQE